jgi:hypothetical protein
VNEETIKDLLRRADVAAPAPSFGPVTAAHLRRRLHHRRIVALGMPAAAAAVVLVGAGLWHLKTGTRVTPRAPEPIAVAELESQIRELRAQSDATLKLVREVLERDRRERHLAAMEDELARIGDPMQEIQRQVDKTAFVMVYQADRLYKELNQTESAVEAYKEVIQLFPDNRWADVARERLSQIEKRQINKSDRKGEPKCGPQRV